MRFSPISKALAMLAVSAIGLMTASAQAQVIVNQGNGFPASPILAPNPVQQISAPPMVFRNDQATPIGYNVPTAVPTAGAVTSQHGRRHVHHAAAHGTGLETPAANQGLIETRQGLQAPLIAPASGIPGLVPAYPGYAPSVPHAAPALPQPLFGSASAQTYHGASPIPVQGIGHAPHGPVHGVVHAPVPPVQHAPMLSTVRMPVTVMTPRVVIPVQRP